MSGVWLLANELCSGEAGGAAQGDQDAWCCLLAGQILAESANLASLRDRTRKTLDCVRRNLARVIEYTQMGRAFQIVEQVNGWKVVTDPQCANWVRQLFPESKPARPGDIRHSCADISLARELLGYAPRYAVPEGLKTLAD